MIWYKITRHEGGYKNLIHDKITMPDSETSEIQLASTCTSAKTHIITPITTYPQFHNRVRNVRNTTCINLHISKNTHNHTYHDISTVSQQGQNQHAGYHKTFYVRGYPWRFHRAYSHGYVASYMYQPFRQRNLRNHAPSCTFTGITWHDADADTNGTHSDIGFQLAQFPS